MQRYIRTSPFDFDQFFGRYQPANNNQEACSKTQSPRVDIYETDTGYQLIAELPGIAKENVNVSIEDSTLTIEAKPESRQLNSEEFKAVRKERFNGHYVRNFSIGEELDQEAIVAEFKDGLLILTLQRAKQTIPEKRQIEIH